MPSSCLPGGMFYRKYRHDGQVGASHKTHSCNSTPSPGPQPRSPRLPKWEPLPTSSPTSPCPNYRNFRSLYCPSPAAWRCPPSLSRCNWSRESSVCLPIWPIHPLVALKLVRVFFSVKTRRHLSVNRSFDRREETIGRSSRAACPAGAPSPWCFAWRGNRHARCTGSQWWLGSFRWRRRCLPCRQEAVRSSSHHRASLAIFFPFRLTLDCFHLSGHQPRNSISARSMQRAARTLSLHCTRQRKPKVSSPWSSRRSQTDSPWPTAAQAPSTPSACWSSAMIAWSRKNWPKCTESIHCSADLT